MAGGLLSALFFSTTAMGQSKPNIVFILVDDLGNADVGFNGSTYYETPNIDSLAGSGLVIENAYMYPTCSPSRTALATGKQSFRTGVYTVPVLAGPSVKNTRCTANRWQMQDTSRFILGNGTWLDRIQKKNWRWSFP
mgnify:CR=1 FL=1